MNETRGNSRTKQMRGGLKGGEINSLKDSEKTNECIVNICCFFNLNKEHKTASIHNTFTFHSKSMTDFIIELDKLCKKYIL